MLREAESRRSCDGTLPGINCIGNLGFGINLGEGSGLTQIHFAAPTTTSPTVFKQMLLFMHPFGGCPTTTTCANYSEALSIDLTVTP